MSKQCPLIMKDGKTTCGKPVEDGKQFCNRHHKSEGKCSDEDIPFFVLCIKCKARRVIKSQNGWCDKCIGIHCKWILQDGRQCYYRVLKGEEYCGTHIYHKHDMVVGNQRCTGCRNLFTSTNGFKTCDACHNRKNNPSNNQIKPQNIIKTNHIIDTQNMIDKELLEFANENQNKQQNNLDAEIKEFINKNQEMITSANNVDCPLTQEMLDEVINENEDIIEPKMDQSNKQVKICKGITKNNTACEYKVVKGEEYCTKHLKIYKREQEEIAGNFKYCDSRWACDNHAMDNDHFCEICRERTRKFDRNRHHKKIIKSEVIIIENGISFKICIDCKRKKDAKEFISLNGQPTLRCQECLIEQRKYESQRIRDRDWTAEYEKIKNDPEYIARKKKWKEDNSGKCAKYWITHRKKVMEQIDKYLKNNKEYQKKYREKYPERVKETKDRNKLYIKVKDYMIEARNKGIDWNLSRIEAMELFCNNCFYCDTESKFHKLNGIDRLLCDGCYDKNNTETCCKECNYMKNTMNPYLFVKRCIHIATHHKFINGELFPELFQNCENINYAQYKKSAEKRNIIFNIEQDLFEKLIRQSCYICGKIIDNTHLNGIDRYNNEVGYENENIRPCCTTCNIMKRDYSMYIFLSKCIKIANKYNKKYEQLEKYNKNIDKQLCVNPRKLSKDEKANNIILLKKQQSSNRINNNTEENINIRVQDIVTIRKIKGGKLNLESEKVKPEIKEYIEDKNKEKELIKILQNKNTQLMDSEIKENDNLKKKIITLFSKYEIQIKLTPEEIEEENQIRKQIIKQKKSENINKKKNEILLDQQLYKEKKEKERLRKAEQRQKEKEKKGILPKQPLTPEEKKEKERIRKATYRKNKKNIASNNSIGK